MFGYGPLLVIVGNYLNWVKKSQPSNRPLLLIAKTLLYLRFGLTFLIEFNSEDYYISGFDLETLILRNKSYQAHIENFLKKKT